MTIQSDRRQAAVFVNESAEIVWGLTPRQRLERALTRVTATGGKADSAGLVFRADAIFDEALVRALLQQPGKVLVNAAGQPMAGHADDPSLLPRLQAAIEAGDPHLLPPGLTTLDAGGLDRKSVV